MGNNRSDTSAVKTAIISPTVLVCLALFLVSQGLFLVNIQYPSDHNFDETNYVPAAKQFIQMKENKNWEHPPLAKELMAVGIMVFGDRPIGWRYMSALFGSLTLVGMYLWALVLFRDRRKALFAALITLVNQLLYVQARIGTLDVFMVAFTVFAVVAFCAAWSEAVDSRKTFSLCLVAGVMFGLAMACKWAAMVPWLSSILMIALLKLLQHWHMFFRGESRRKARSRAFEDWYSPNLLGGIGVTKLAIALVIVPVIVYFLTFLPFLFIRRADQTTYSMLDLITMQLKMWHGQISIATAHPYMSTWPSWSLMIRPIWYAFDNEGEGFCRGVILLGNPLIMWSGLIALLFCMWAWIRHRSREALASIAYSISAGPSSRAKSLFIITIIRPV
jgi:dolichyl-phosphate-mannose-protein mannosyltransferase